MNLLHIANPRAFLIPALSDFMLKSLASSPLMPDAQAALVEIADLLYTRLLGLFIVQDPTGKFVGMCLAENNPSALSPGCTVLHFFNAGGTESRKLLIQALIAFAHSGGHTKIRGFDASHKPRAFARLFRGQLGPAKALGEIFEFEPRIES